MTSTATIYVDSQNTTLITYNPSGNADWYFTHSSNQEVYQQTLTTAVNPGGSATLRFVGTGVQVYGTVGPPTNGSSPPVSIYSVDGATPISFIAPTVASEADGVKFFDSGPLANGTHILALNVTQVVPACQYMLDYIAYTMQVPTASSSSSASSSASSSSLPISFTAILGSSTGSGTVASTTQSAASATSSVTSSGPSGSPTGTSTSTPVGAIVGGVVGGIGGLAVVLVALFFWWRHRRAGRGDQFYYSTPVYPYNPDDGNEDAAVQQGGTNNVPPHMGLGAAMVQSGPSGGNDNSLVAWPTSGSGPSHPSGPSGSSALSSTPSIPLSPGVLITPFTAAAPSSAAASTPQKVQLNNTGPAVSSSSTQLDAHAYPLPPSSSGGSSDQKSASTGDASSSRPLVEAPAPEPNFDSGIRFAPRVAPSEVGIVDAPPVYTED